MFSHFSCLSHFGLIVTKLILITKNAAISLFFITQRAVKAWNTKKIKSKGTFIKQTVLFLSKDIFDRKGPEIRIV